MKAPQDDSSRQMHFGHPCGTVGRHLGDDVRAGRLGRQINDAVYAHDVANGNR